MQAGNETADVQDLLHHAEWLRHLATRLVNESDVDDVLQETWMAAMRSPPRSAGAAARPWLAEVARNFARRRWRTGGVRRRAEAELGQIETPPVEAADELLERATVQRALADLVLALDEPYRTAVLLRYYEGKSAADIARSLGVPAGTVRWRLSEGVERLRKRLDEQHGGRQRWRALLAPLCLPRLPKTAPLVAAAAAGSGSKTTVAIAAVALALVAGGLIWHRNGDAEQRAFDVAAARPALRARVALDEDARAAKSAIEGTVLDAAGKPLQGAVVALSRAPGSGEGGRRAPSGAAVTDEGGRFVFENAWPGTYRASASATGATVALSPIFTLGAGQRYPLTLRLGQGGSTLSGVVLDEGGGAIPGARVVATLGYPWEMATSVSHPARAYETVADAEGRYRLTLEPREYVLQASASGYAPTETTAAVTREVVRDLRLAPAARIFGRVVERSSGEPVGGAAVDLMIRDAQGLRRSSETRRTDAEGRFGFDDVVAGTYQVVARDRERNLGGSGPVVTAIPTGSTTGIEVALDPAALIAGRLIDGAGQPVPGAELLLHPTDRGQVGFSRILTADDGSFQVGGILPGRYRLLARGGEGVRSETTIDIVNERRKDVTITLKETAEGRALTGRVFGTNGEPAAGVLVRSEVIGKRGQLPVAVESDEAGHFALKGITNAPTALLAWHPSQGTAWLTLDPARNPTAPVELRLAVGAIVGGVVKYDDGSPAAGISVAATRQQGTVVYDSTTTGPDGRFELRSLAEGQYTVNATRKLGPHNLWTSRETDSLKLVTLAAGEQKRELVLVVKRGGRIIEGRVFGPDGKPVAGVKVVANHESEGRSWKPPGHQLQFVGTSREDGGFRIDDVDAGTYWLWAILPGHPEFIEKGVTAGRTDVRLVLPAGAAVAGHVVDHDGKPLADYSLWVLPAPTANETQEQKWKRMEAGQQAPLRVRDPSGAFSVAGLDTGPFELRVTAAAGGANLPVSLTAGETKAGLKLVLRAGTKAIGKVVHLEDGKPCEGASVSAQVAGRPFYVQTAADGSFEIDKVLAGETLRIDVRDDHGPRVPETVELTIQDGKTRFELGTIKLMQGDLAAKMGERGSTGLRPESKNGEPKVAAVTPGSVAARAGVLAGDRLLKVGDRDVNGLGEGAVIYLLSRKPGESITVTLQSPGGEPRQATLVAEARKR